MKAAADYDEPGGRSAQDREDRNVYGQSGWNELDGSDFFPTPLSELVRVEEAELREFQTMNREEIRRIRVETISLFLRSIIGDPEREPDIVSAGLNCFTYAWDLDLPPFDKMTQEKIGAMVAQGRAAICERHKKLSDKKKAGGGRKSKREKSGTLRNKLAKSALGNNSRHQATALAILHEGMKPKPETDN